MIESALSHSMSGRWERRMNAFHRVKAALELAKDEENTVGSAGIGVPLF